MKAATALIQFQSWAQEESAAQGRLAEALERMEASLAAAGDEELELACSDLDAVLDGGRIRAEQRARLAACLGEHFGVSPKTLSLGSILERAERSGLVDEAVLASLRALREGLISRVREVSRRSRRMSAVAGHQRGMLKELLEILAPAGVGACGMSGQMIGGNLVNAEG